MKNLSYIANNLQGQKMFQVMALAKKLERQGVNVIHLEIGDPDFDSPPNVVEAACDALRDGQLIMQFPQAWRNFVLQQQR